MSANDKLKNGTVLGDLVAEGGVQLKHSKRLVRGTHLITVM